MIQPLLAWGALIAWAIIGIPYGILVYKAAIDEGLDNNAAMFRAVVRGVCWPIEKLARKLWSLISSLRK